MTYEAVDRLSQIVTLSLFIALFVGALAYALWPGNAATFDRAARLPLQRDPEAAEHEANDAR